MTTVIEERQSWADAMLAGLPCTRATLRKVLGAHRQALADYHNAQCSMVARLAAMACARSCYDQARMLIARGARLRY